jgi:hypothetical protein
MDAYDRIRRLRDEYEAALDDAERLRDAYHREVVKLHRSGVSLREIAENLGISHQRVHQIVSPANRGSPRSGRRGSAAAAGAAMLIIGTVAFFAGRSTTSSSVQRAGSPSVSPSPLIIEVVDCGTGKTLDRSSLSLAVTAADCQDRLGRLLGRSEIRSITIQPGTGRILGFVSVSDQIPPNVLLPPDTVMPSPSAAG